MYRRKKNKNFKLICIICIIALFFISNSYAMLSDRLTISGTANIKYNQEAALAEHDIYEPMQETPNYSNCTYTYKNVSNWKQADGIYIYEIELSIINLDKDYVTGNLEISFEGNQGLAKEQSKENLGILQAKKVLITGNKVTALLTEENSKVKYGEKINLCIYLSYENEQENGITLDNVTLNGNKLVEEKEKIDDINIEDNKEEEMSSIELKSSETTKYNDININEDKIELEEVNKESQKEN